MKRTLLPLLLFIVLLGFLAMGLTRDPRAVPSPLIGKPAPAFSLPTIGAPDKLFAAQSLRGRVWLLNVWASWCTACRHEHSVLRSEEHTSELQSLMRISYAVFCLKKKKIK